MVFPNPDCARFGYVTASMPAGLLTTARQSMQYYACFAEGAGLQQGCTENARFPACVTVLPQARPWRGSHGADGCRSLYQHRGVSLEAELQLIASSGAFSADAVLFTKSRN